MPRGIHKRTGQLQSHPRGVPFTISPRETIRYLHPFWKKLCNEDRTHLICGICKGTISPDDVVVLYQTYLVHYPVCDRIRGVDVKDEDLTGEELKWIETGRWDQ